MKTTNKYEFTPEMNEISGFGGGYEEACRKMLKAGLEWWDEHPDADPHFRGMKNVYGILMEDNEDAKALSEAMMAPVKGEGATGAMHQGVVGHIFFIRREGWDRYVEEMSKKDSEST